MFKKLAAVLIAASVVGAPMFASAQSSPSSAPATESRAPVKAATPHKTVMVKKHRAAHRHHVKRVKVVTAHRHGRHVAVVKHRKHVKHVRHIDGSKKVVIKNTTRTN